MAHSLKTEYKIQLYQKFIDNGQGRFPKGIESIPSTDIDIATFLAQVIKEEFEEDNNPNKWWIIITDGMFTGSVQDEVEAYIMDHFYNKGQLFILGTNNHSEIEERQHNKGKTSFDMPWMFLSFPMLQEFEDNDDINLKLYKSVFFLLDGVCKYLCSNHYGKVPENNGEDYIDFVTVNALVRALIVGIKNPNSSEACKEILNAIDKNIEKAISFFANEVAQPIRGVSIIHLTTKSYNEIVRNGVTSLRGTSQFSRIIALVNSHFTQKEYIHFTDNADVYFTFNNLEFQNYFESDNITYPFVQMVDRNFYNEIVDATQLHETNNQPKVNDINDILEAEGYGNYREDENYSRANSD